MFQDGIWLYGLSSLWINARHNVLLNFNDILGLVLNHLLLDVVKQIPVFYEPSVSLLDLTSLSHHSQQISLCGLLRLNLVPQSLILRLTLLKLINLLF